MVEGWRDGFSLGAFMAKGAGDVVAGLAVGWLCMSCDRVPRHGQLHLVLVLGIGQVIIRTLDIVP